MASVGAGQIEGRIMRIVFTFLLLVASGPSFAARILECERYTVSTSQAAKQNRTIFTLTYFQEKSVVVYTKKTGPEWFLPSGTSLSVFWESDDGLRVVASWIDKNYGKEDKVFSPVHVVDIDFSRPQYKAEAYGGLIDFDPVISDPWKQECSRVD
jgi:hypothetical protein